MNNQPEPVNKTATQVYPATLIVHTPTGAVSACQHHAVSIVRMVEFMGASATCSFTEGEVECTNCVNEARKAGAK